MTVYKFDEFRFDSMNYQLTHRGKQVALRPKAQKLLNLLIQNRERVIAKSEIMASVWDSNYARDHLLFQLISELRKPPLRADFLRTQPNEGYQWTVPTKVVRRPIRMPLKFVASMASAALCLMAWFTMTATISTTMNGGDITTAKSDRLPAHSAFSKGVVALEREDNELAAEWFEFALTENPESVESSLFLAETLLKQDKTAESSAQLQALLEKPTLDAYNKMTATDLLSRVRQREGRLHDALRYARESGQANVIAQCSVDVVERRIEMLEGELGLPVASSGEQQGADGSGSESNGTRPENYETQCGQLNTDTKKTSYCEPEDTDSYYASTTESRVIGVS
ncbi:winged helix-turn-helix domain-containing protein [Arenicella xantha]|nr:winged helix-turn-helix domain-containing protein [Arenicella xantha]